MSVIWHDLECGTYAEDLPLWRSLAAEHGDPVLDIGAGTGRVTLDLASAGYRVTALDRDPELLGALAERASGRNVAKTRRFFPSACHDRGRGRSRLRPRRAFPVGHRADADDPAARRPGRSGRVPELRTPPPPPGGVLAIAIAEALDLYDVTDGVPSPTPDIRELDGVVYSSRPVAVRADPDGFVLERLRETVAVAGERTVEHNLIRLDRLTARGLEREGRAAGFTRVQRARVRETSDYVGSEVVILHA